MKANRILFFLILSFIYLLSKSQVGSLKNLLRNNLNDTHRVTIYLALAEQIEDEAQWTAYNDSALLLINSKIEKADVKLKYFYNKALASAYNNKGYYFDFHGKQEAALDIYLQGLKISEEIKDELAQAKVINNIAMVYRNQAEYASALKYLNVASIIFNKKGYKSELATVYNNIGHINQTLKKYDDAIKNFRLSTQIRIELKDSLNILNSLHSLFILYYTTKQIDSSCFYSLKAMELAEILKTNKGRSASYTYVGQMYLDKNNIERANEYATKGLELAEKLGYPEYIKRASLLMTEVYLRKRNFEKAFYTYKLFNKMRDSIANTENKTAAIKQNLKSEYEKEKIAVQKEQEKKNIIEQGEKRRKNIIIFITTLVGVLVFIFAVIILKRYKITQLQKQIIETQKNDVDEKQKEIVDSINYAKRIQEALLPAKEIKYKIFPDAFVLFQPKDIVSGDFYWFAEKNNKRLIAAVDCTGHGVPGAFMSMIGNTFLNEIVNVRGITNPAEILNQLRQQIITSLKQTGSCGENKDGMDISLLCFDDKKNSVEFAGANNPLWLIRAGNCFEYKADKQPVGYYLGKTVPFKNVNIPLQKGDVLYIFTDGFADQFGGEKGKKFKYKNLKDILIAAQAMPMQEQEEQLLKTFNDWKNNLEQVDDVCVIGIRV